MHAIIIWYVFRGAKPSSFKGYVYRPSSTVYVTLKHSGRGTSRALKASKSSKTKSYVIKKRKRYKKKRKLRVSKASSRSRRATSRKKKTAIGGGGAGQATPLFVNTALKMYYDAVWERIKGNWKIPGYLKGKGLIVVISIKLRKDGTVEDMYIERSSGNRVFDDFAVKAIKASSPFPPIPDAVKKKEMELGIIFKE